MNTSNRLRLMLATLTSLLLLSACSSTDHTHVSGSVQSVYGGYGYPYYGYCCHNDVIIINPPDRPVRPIRPTPLPGEPDRPSIGKPQKTRPSTGMGRPSRGQMGGGLRRR